MRKHLIHVTLVIRLASLIISIFCMSLCMFVYCLLFFSPIVKVLEKCTKNLIGHSRLAFNNHESNIDC